MLKILQARLQQYVNHELPDVQARFTTGRENRDQIVNIHWIIKTAREFQKITYLCFIDYASLWLCGSPQTVENSEKDGLPNQLTCLLRNLYAGQEADMEQQTGSK